MMEWYEPEDWETVQARRDEQEYQLGIAETKAAQEAGPAGSAEREAAYRQMEMDAYNRGDD